MNLRLVRRVFRKEMLETIRDRRTMIIMLVVPVFLYPGLLVVTQQLAIFGQRQLEEAPVTVVAQGAPASAEAALSADSMIRLRRAEGQGPEVVNGRDAEVFIRFAEPVAADSAFRVELYFDATRDRSRIGRDATVAGLNEWEDQLLAERLQSRGLGADFLEPVEVVDTSIASAQRMGGYTLGRFLPMLLIFMTLLGAFYPAIDLSAGEKERGTLETLLTTPVPARELVAGKFLTVTVMALGAAMLNLASMLLTIRFASMQLAEAVQIDFSLPASTIVLVLLFLIPLAVFFAALFLGLALRAQSFKEAQNALTPVQLAATIPIILPMIPGIPLSYTLALVPVGGVALLFREMMSGTAQVGPGAVAMISTLFYAGLALRFAASSFGREEVLFGTGTDAVTPVQGWRERWAGWQGRARGLPTPAEGLAFVAAVGLLYFYLGTTLQLRLGERGLMLSQVLLLALPAVLAAFAGPYRPRSALALRLPSLRGLAAGTLIIVGGMPVGWMLVWLQSFFLEIPPEFMEALEQLIRAESTDEIVWLLLLVAVTPAICEELVFRGFLLQGLSSRMTMARSVALSALIFGAFHLSTATAIRLLPTAWLGVLLAMVVWRTRSLFTSMWMHFVNNGTIVLLLAFPALESFLGDPEGQPNWLLVAAGAMLLIGGFMALPPRHERQSSSPSTSAIT